MDKVSPEFKQFVKCVIHDVHYPKLTFKTAEELKICIKYFFEKAIADINISSRFATQANRLHFVFPENEKFPNCSTFRRVLVKEAKQQAQEMGEMLNSASCVTSDRARGTYKFFGDLFNIGFIFVVPLRKTMAILHSLSAESELAMDCLTLLVNTVRENVKFLPDDHSGDYKFLIEMVNKPEFLKNGPKVITKPEPLNLENQFPSLNGHSKSPDIKMSTEDKLRAFSAILDTLTSYNCADVIKKIEDSDKNLFENTSWQAYYDLLIAEALLQPDLAESIVNISQKLSKTSNVWNSVKKEDYQKYIFNIIAKEIEASPTQSRETAIMNLFKTLINKSLCSLGNIATLLVAANSHSTTNLSASASILCKIVEIIKWKFSEVKIQKLPEETRKKAVEIMKTKGMNEEKFALIEKYLLGDGRDAHQQSDIEPKDNVLDTISTTRSGPSSPVGTPSTNLFNVHDFFEEAISQNFDALTRYVQSSMLKIGWDSTKVASTVLQKVLADHRKEIYFMRIAIAINNETGNDEFGKKLGKLVTDALKAGLRCSESEENCRNLITTAVFLSDLYKHGWISSQDIFTCMDVAASDEFESFGKVKILKGLIKPSVGQLKMQCNDDRFTFYLQLIRKRMTEDKIYERQTTYSELIDLLIRITSFEECSSFDSEDGSSTSSATFSSATTNSAPAVDHTVGIQHLMKDYMPSKKNIVSKGISFVIREHPDEIEKMVSCVIDRALEQINESETFVALMTSLSENLSDLENFLTYEDCIKIYFQQTFDGVAEGRFPNDDISLVYKAMVFYFELFKDQPIDNKVIVGVIENLMKNEKTCVKSVQCIVHLMRTIGEKVEKENVKAIDRYFQYFEHVIRDSNQDDFRTYEYKKLIEYRANGWRNADNYTLNGSSSVKIREDRVMENEKEWTRELNLTLEDLLGEETRWKPTQDFERPAIAIAKPSIDPVPVEKAQKFDKTTKPGELVLTLKNLEDNDQVNRLAVQLGDLLNSEKHLQAFIAAVLNRETTNRHEISMYMKLLRKLVEIFENSDDAQVEFVEHLIDVINTQFADTSGWKNFDDAMKIKFRRLVIISSELYRINVLSDEDFAPWLYHKHIQQLTIEELSDLSAEISPRIEANGSKRIKLALSMLEKTIHEVTIDMCNAIRSDIDQLNETFDRMSKIILNHQLAGSSYSPSLY